MNAKTIAATLVIVSGLTVGGTAYAAPGHDGGCGNGHGASQGCEPDRGNECSNGQHSGNPHCEPDSTPTSTPTPEPTVAPTVTPTVVPTPEATPIVDEQSIDPCDGPKAQLPANCFAVATPTGERIVVHVFAPTPTPVIAGNPVPLITPVPVVDDFDISQVTSLPHAGDGSSQQDGNGSFFGGLVTGGTLAAMIALTSRLFGRRSD